MLSDKTAEFLSIGQLHSILFDDKIFSEFMEQKGKFFDSSLYDTAILDLNNYFKIIIDGDGYIPKSVFERISMINEKFECQDKYSYEEYLLTDSAMISVFKVEDILGNDDAYAKFLDFENNLDYFDNLPILPYLLAIKKYYEDIKNSGLSSEYIMNVRYRAIMEKYALELKIYHEIEGEDVTEEMDEEFVDEIFNEIDLASSPLEIAYQVYIELNRRCVFSTDFLAYKQDISKKPAKDVYDKNIIDINKDSNSVSCKSWSKMYAKLLNLLGIEAKVCGDFHKYVVFDCDGTLIKADATAPFKNRDRFVINDLIRCQSNLQPTFFVCLEEDKNIQPFLDDMYAKSYGANGLNVNLQRQVMEYRTRYVKESKVSIESRLELVAQKIDGSTLSGVEAMVYLSKLVKILFSDEEYLNTDAQVVVVWDDVTSSYVAAFAICLSVEAGLYKVYYKGKGYIDYTSSELDAMLKEGKLVIVGKNAKGILADKEREYEKYR